MACFWRAFSGHSLWDILDRLAEDCAKQNGVLHLWGHSREIEQYDLWQDLDAYFSRLKQFTPVPKTVAESVSDSLSEALHSYK